jgi:glyoxylase-like metal-dependent hydrolase (beta-lactamase superfamily II)
MKRFILALLLVSACNLREFATDQAVGAQVKFIPDPEHLSGFELTKLNDRVYTFRWTWDRSLVVLTSEGWVVTDPFNREAAEALAGELAKVAPGQPVHTMFYSHYHLDHVVGGAPLHPRNVVAHAKCPAYWNDLRDSPEVADILPPTELIEGDKKYVIGGVEFDLLDLGHTHTDTLYAFYLPGEKVLHTADMGIIRTMFPIGGPDMYTPGILRQMERLSALEFETYLPSHFGYGTKADFLAALEFNKTVRRLSVEAVQKYGVPKTKEQYLASFHSIYDPLKAKYGGYHGFDEEALFVVARSVSGALLGY